MTWFADLAPCNYFGEKSSALIAVGWLGENQSYPQGEVRRELSDKLDTLLVEAWQPILFRGFHGCEICADASPAKNLPMPVPFDLTEAIRRIEAAGEDVYAWRRTAIGNPGFWNLFIPSENGLFASPSMIGHYIKAHHYQPPDVFCAAVMDCPPMGSQAYFEAVAACAPAELLSEYRSYIAGMADYIQKAEKAAANASSRNTGAQAQNEPASLREIYILEREARAKLEAFNAQRKNTK